MRLKRFALRGLIVMAVAVALCMFFARTVQTITTAKVRLVSAGNGRFEDKMTFKAEVYFPETEEITVEAAVQTPVTVDKVRVKPGSWVHEGDVVFTCKASGFEETMKKLEEDYAAKNVELLELDAANRSKSRDSKANQCYEAMLDAAAELSEASLAAQTLAAKGGVKLTGVVAEWPKLLALMDEAPSDELTAAAAKAAAAQSRYDTAFEEYRAVMEDRKQRISSDTFEYIKKRNAIIHELNGMAEKLVEATLACEALQTITAPHSGYITAVAVSAGDAYDGKKAAYTLSAADEAPLLRASLEGVKRVISDGTKGEVTVDGGDREKVSVSKTAVGTDGKKYLYVTLPASMSREGSSALRRAMTDGVEVSITYRASSSSTLLTPSVVRADGDNSFVYLVERTAGSLLSSAGMKVVRMNVTVLERSDKTVSVAEDLSYQQLADREDRTLSDGQAVMEYVD